MKKRPSPMRALALAVALTAGTALPVLILHPAPAWAQGESEFHQVHLQVEAAMKALDAHDMKGAAAAIDQAMAMVHADAKLASLMPALTKAKAMVAANDAAGAKAQLSLVMHEMTGLNNGH